MAGLAAVVSSAVACGAVAPTGYDMRTGALPSMPEGSMGRIEVRQLAERPRLTLVSRDGDPSPVVVAAVATDLGPIASTALAAVVEARMRAAGFAIDTRVDRSAFRVRWAVADAARLPAFVEALAAAFRAPIANDSAALTLAAQRIAALRRNPLEAEAMIPIAACTGALGIAATETTPDLASAQGARDVEAWRRSALQAGRTSLAAVGPTAFCVAMARALEGASGWETGAPAADEWPATDTLGVYLGTAETPSGGRLTVATRVDDPYAAVAAATRLGDPDAPLLGRLATLPEGWRATRVTGSARPAGGCVSVTVEPTDEADAPRSIEEAASVAATILQQEMRVELLGARGPDVATQQVLTAADPLEAASRAAWWALAGAAQPRPPRTAVVLALPPPRGASTREPNLDEARRSLQREMLVVASSPSSSKVERRALVERGQGELWVLLASPCGAADEGTLDAGATALGALSAIQTRRGSEVAIEPWITADGIGVIAHAAPKSATEAPAELARRVADAAAQALLGTPVASGALVQTRGAVLRHVDRTRGGGAAAIEGFVSAIAPEHPSWLDPLGIWSRLAANGPDVVDARWRALREGPLRASVLANVDSPQADVTFAAIDRWLPPRRSAPRACPAAQAGSPKPGLVKVQLLREESLSQALIGAAIPAVGAPGHDVARLLAAALDGDDGSIAKALREASIPGETSTRILGGSRVAALVVDVRAPNDALEKAIAIVRSILENADTLGSEPLLASATAAAAASEQRALSDPRRRLADLWLGARPAYARPRLDLLRAFVKTTFAKDKLVVVEARHP